MSSNRKINKVDEGGNSGKEVKLRVALRTYRFNKEGVYQDPAAVNVQAATERTKEMSSVSRRDFLSAQFHSSLLITAISATSCASSTPCISATSSTCSSVLHKLPRYSLF